MIDDILKKRQLLLVKLLEIKINKENNLDLQVLTSTSGNWILKNNQKEDAKEIIRNIEKGKLEWLKNYWPGLKVNFSGSGRGKGRFAKPNSCLIDDLPNNIESFIESGGKGIIYTSADQTLNELQIMVKNI